ncbi:hypothetical protein diail_4658 [Diaporthe ilicicola]|nr:hypothetical protein diail_4658 [Diaporthe ilicicola]
MLFKSSQPDIIFPAHQSVWAWLFDSPEFPLPKLEAPGTGGFTDVHTKEKLTHQKIKRHSTSLSVALTSHFSLGEGDVILLYSNNTIWYPVVTLSAARLGAIACGVSPAYTVEELSYSLRISRAKCIFTSTNGLANALESAKQCSIPEENVILLEPSESNRADIRGLIQRGSLQKEALQARPFQIPKGKTNADISAFLCFSSGTTGLPKAVMISHANLIAQCLQVQQMTPRNHTKILAALPFYHITGIVHQLHLPVLLNAQVYVLPSFSLDTLLEAVSTYKVKELLIVPPILIQLVRGQADLARYNLSQLERFSSGAAPLSQEILNLLEQKFPGTGFKQQYGMTESCSAITSHPPSKYAYKYADKVGMLVASTEVKVVHPDTGAECGVNEAGEIWARGPQVAMGYLGNPQATAETFDKDGFLHTGDIGKFDGEGMLSIIDRIKDMIKVNGIGVAPAELENVLLGHPAVSDAAVCGIPDSRSGERPKAFVVVKSSPRENAEVAEQLMQYVKSRKARHKWVTEVEIVPNIPKSASGKILRRQLGTTPGQKGAIARDKPPRAKI